MKDPYSVLGLSPETPEEELKARYEELKAEYGEQRFKTGAEGNEGARKLSELETAWSEISAKFGKAQSTESASNADYDSIDELIKKGEYNDAQAKLDEITDRTAQWHYLQSIIYYKREWMTDSRNQLAEAVKMDPTNDKYRTALEKLDLVIGNPQADPRTIGANGDQPPQQQGNGGQVCGGNTLSNCCLAYLCTDCCCTMTRCCG